MVPARQFNTLPVQRQPELQPASPVYVHCSRRCEERDTGTMLLQVRLINRTERTVRSVLLRAEGLSESGVVIFATDPLILADLAAGPHSIFGEDRLLVIDRTPVARVRIAVEEVVFDDGMQWRRLPDQGFASQAEANWHTCTCGMRNPAEAVRCALCGVALQEVGTPASAEAPLPEFPIAQEEGFPASADDDFELPRPQPVVRTFYQETSTEDEDIEDGEDGEAPGWLVALLCLFGVCALLAVVAFLSYCFLQYTGKI